MFRAFTSKSKPNFSSIDSVLQFNIWKVWRRGVWGGVGFGEKKERRVLACGREGRGGLVWRGGGGGKGVGLREGECWFGEKGGLVWVTITPEASSHHRTNVEGATDKFLDDIHSCVDSHRIPLTLFHFLRQPFVHRFVLRHRRLELFRYAGVLFLQVCTVGVV